MTDYSKLEQLLKSRGLTKSELGKTLGISSRTIAKMKKGEKIRPAVLQRLCAYLNCYMEDICCEKSDNILLQFLRDEKDAGITGGIYHELQIRMTYNSNHMEGSKLTEEQTRLIFETNTIDVGDGIPVDDILETVHHFRAIDYCIDHAEAELTESMIKHLHYILKRDTKDERLAWFSVGDYKKRPNMVGGKDTTSPAQVSFEIRKLLEWYGTVSDVSIDDIIQFHVRFERIHPFQDGNGRVGRLIMFKECLRHGVTPFIIEEDLKSFYYRGLNEWNNEQGYLKDTCLTAQDRFKAYMDYYKIPYND